MKLIGSRFRKDPWTLTLWNWLSPDVVMTTRLHHFKKGLGKFMGDRSIDGYQPWWLIQTSKFRLVYATECQLLRATQKKNFCPPPLLMGFPESFDFPQSFDCGKDIGPDRTLIWSTRSLLFLRYLAQWFEGSNCECSPISSGSLDTILQIWLIHEATSWAWTSGGSTGDRGCPPLFTSTTPPPPSVS